MSQESNILKEVPNREGVRSAIEQYSQSTNLLFQVEGLSREAYLAIDMAVNLHKITYNDFALYLLDGGDPSIISALLTELETVESEAERDVLIGQIVKALLI